MDRGFQGLASGVIGLILISCLRSVLDVSMMRMSFSLLPSFLSFFFFKE